MRKVSDGPSVNFLTFLLLTRFNRLMNCLRNHSSLESWARFAWETVNFFASLCYNWVYNIDWNLQYLLDRTWTSSWQCVIKSKLLTVTVQARSYSQSYTGQWWHQSDYHHCHCLHYSNCLGSWAGVTWAVNMVSGRSRGRGRELLGLLFINIQ